MDSLEVVALHGKECGVPLACAVLLPAGRLVPCVLLRVVVEVVELPILSPVFCPPIWTLACVRYLRRWGNLIVRVLSVLSRRHRQCNTAQFPSWLPFAGAANHTTSGPWAGNSRDGRCSGAARLLLGALQATMGGAGPDIGAAIDTAHGCSAHAGPKPAPTATWPKSATATKSWALQMECQSSDITLYKDAACSRKWPVGIKEASAQRGSIARLRCTYIVADRAPLRDEDRIGKHIRLGVALQHRSDASRAHLVCWQNRTAVSMQT